MEDHSTADIETIEGVKKGLTRRQVAVGAAWAAPVVALAVATPFASASVVFDSPTAYVTGSIAATGTSATARSATYPGGSVSYTSAGVTGQDSGNLTLTVYNTKPTIWTTTINVPAFVTAGWALVSQDPTSQTYVFSHAPISNGATVSVPTVVWNAPKGSSKPVVGINLDSDNDDVSGVGVATN